MSVNLSRNSSTPYISLNALPNAEADLRTKNSNRFRSNKELSDLKERVTQLDTQIKAYKEHPYKTRGKYCAAGIGLVALAAGITALAIWYFRHLRRVSSPHANLSLDYGIMGLSCSFVVGGSLLGGCKAFYEAFKSIKTIEKERNEVQEKVNALATDIQSQNKAIQDQQIKIQGFKQNLRLQLDEMYRLIEKEKKENQDPDIAKLHVRIYAEKANQIARLLNDSENLGPLKPMTDEQWKVFASHVPDLPSIAGKETPDKRKLLDTMIYSWNSGTGKQFPVGLQWVSQTTVYDYMSKWSEDGTLSRLKKVASELSLLENG